MEPSTIAVLMVVFFSWMGQFQWVQRLSPRVLMLAKINTQLTPDSLLSLEKISIGGVDTVRGYGQNQLMIRLSIKPSFHSS
jgi:hemolysin activation/secretion protein